MNYEDEDTYDQVQDERIELAGLASQPIPDPVPRPIESGLLSPGDLIELPWEAFGLEPGTSCTVARSFPFEGGASVDCQLEDGREIQVALYDKNHLVILRATGAQELPRHQDRCEWFAACTNAADGDVRHPVLGMVPTCRRCADKLDLDLCARVAS